jgi:cell division protein FtsI (penicillin-binding protein 3)
LLLIAASRATWLGVVRGSSLQAVASTQQVEELKVPAERGAITDRHGIELAVSEPAEDVAVTPYLVKQPLAVARKLAPLLDMTQAQVLDKLDEKGGFVYLRRNVPATQTKQIHDLDLPGLQFTPSGRREYPRKWLASQVLGWIGTDGQGLGGLEYAEDKVLRGTDGERRIVKDARGDPLVLQDTKRAKPGKSLRLTLDAALQGKVEDVLSQVGLKWRPKGATALVMDPYSNTVLALANWPRVDANNRDGAPAYAAQDRAVGSIYEPGSTFKAVTVAGALQDKAVTPDDIFHLPPSIDVADRTIKEAEPRGTVDLSVSQILAQSSNVGTVRIGLRLGATKFDRWVRAFGFGRPTGIELPGEQAGLVLKRNEYSGSSMGNLPIGQGESVTPIQLATAYAAIANGGILRRPRIISEIGGKRTPMPHGTRVITKQTAAQVRTMLEGVVSATGTGSAAAIPGYTLAGKTGTANKIDRKTGEYSKTRFIASFAGFAPARKPKLLVTVMVDEPQGEIFGAEVAAPAFQEIMRFALPYLGVAPGD